VKGEDDIRQDAVMEQVFGCVNELMTRQGESDQTERGNGQGNASTNKPLKLVTYSIVPLSPGSGVLEWVENTIPFGDYITDTGSRKSSRKIGAHSKYYPGEWGNSLCSKQLKNSPQGEKRKAFDAVCDHHSPVFRYFFVERFGNSLEAWHSAKMRYARSVAVNSIVGHVLGIGDRHGSNILVHEKTGEVVHIDFGFVFEQGKVRNPVSFADKLSLVVRLTCCHLYSHEFSSY
jgi:ataxia telangiectasia mutated family protein